MVTLLAGAGSIACSEDDSHKKGFEDGAWEQDSPSKNGKENPFKEKEEQNKKLSIEIDNTIMKVFLNEPIKSGERRTFDIVFKSYFGGNGSVRRRMKVYEEFGVKHYNGVHWYPRISVYDSKFGWTTDQHLGKEFYGDFGCFDVELTLPDNYIMEATGNMLNREKVLPKELMKKLDIKNFSNKKYIRLNYWIWRQKHKSKKFSKIY